MSNVQWILIASATLTSINKVVGDNAFGREERAAFAALISRV